MNGLSFRYCPVCSSELKAGKITLPLGRTLSSVDYVNWYSDENAEYHKRTAINKIGANVPAGYCEKCDSIFAEFDIREKINPIGEEKLLTYDMDYYEESADSLYDDKIVSYDDNINEKYNTIDGYNIITGKEEQL
ncbi:MAG: PF20097 family protein [Ruminococcus flavefaciens]|nr:PF20097 family protein [Ruminococcus flavefaciens]